MNYEKALWKSSGVFAPDYPRQSSDDGTFQAGRWSRSDFCDALQRAKENEMPGYYSVYSFPRGHSRDGNIPKVDCIFIDLDVTGGKYRPNEDHTEFGPWRRDMSKLLTRARMIARALIESGKAEHFRVTLSGHKGLHLYLDFPTIAPANGSFEEFKSGLKEYGEQVMAWLDSTAGGININPWVDVDASDLGRLARHPNTVHHNAAYDDTTRWCVPITVEELSELTVDDYLSLTQAPRWPDGYARSPSKSAGDKVVQAVRNASPATSSSNRSTTTRNPAAVSAYEEKSNDGIELEDVAFLTSNKPCIQAFVERDDAFDHGNASHIMEVSILARLVELGVPRDVIHQFFQQVPGYTEAETDEQIDKVIELDYQDFNCESIADRAPTFCLGSSCDIYNRSSDIQK